MDKTRTIETLDGDLKTINMWKVPADISLDMAIKKQGDAKFRSLYFVSSRPIGASQSPQDGR